MVERFGTGKWMKAGVLAFGGFMLVVGIGIAIWANGQADLVTRIVDPEKYDSFKSMALAGYVVGALGAGITLYGLASSPEHHAHKIPKTHTPMPSDQAEFCQHCGRSLAPDSSYCPGCGRPTKK